jgi:CheY-like chemotaxis protein
MARILITDNEGSDRDILSKIFSELGHEVGTAFNGNEALRLFAESPFDLVTTDFDMPVMDGNILARRIKQKYPHTPVMMITGHALDTESKIAKYGYADLVLSKPFSVKTIEKATEELLYFKNVQ